VVSDTEFETVAEPEVSDLAVDEVAEPKRGWWRRGKQEDLEAESTTSEALDRSEGELGTEGPAVSAAAAGMLDPEAETVEVDDETEVDAAAEAVGADLGEAVDLESDVDEDADVAGIGFFGRLFGRSSQDEGVAIDETVDDAISDAPVAPESETDVDHGDDEWVAYTGVQADTEGVDAAQPAEVAEPEPKLTRRQRRKAEKAAAALAAGAAVDGVPESAMEPDTDDADVDEWVAYAGIETEEVEEAQPAEVAEPEPKLKVRADETLSRKSNTFRRAPESTWDWQPLLRPRREKMTRCRPSRLRCPGSNRESSGSGTSSTPPRRMRSRPRGSSTRGTSRLASSPALLLPLCSSAPSYGDRGRSGCSWFW
jgi:hypothetical protein